MRVYARYGRAARRGRWRDALQTAVALAGLAFLGWVLWRTAQPPASAPGRTTSPREAASGTAAPAAHEPVAPVARLATNPAAARTRLVPGIPDPPAATNRMDGADPAVVPLPVFAGDRFEPRPPRDVLEGQIALARLGYSSGSLDGAVGYQTRAALRAFQRQCSLPVTGVWDDATRRRLRLDSAPLVYHPVTAEDIARLTPVSRTWQGKSQQARLDFENLLELIGERSRAHPALLRRLNPGVDWTNALPGLRVLAPSVPAPVITNRLAWLRIGLQDRLLQGFDLRTNLLLHFPCSIAQRVEKRPLGTLFVVNAAPDPVYTFDPRIFPESPEARRLTGKLTIPAGPNNPVGVAWIGLDRPGYGIHGTPRPEDVGRTESHGCFRLANWDAALLVRLVWRGLPVYIGY